MKISVYVGTSLDGFIARKDGSIDWLVKFDSPDVNGSFQEFESRIDAIVMGRGTYDIVLPFPTWPYEKMVFVLSSTVKQVPAKLTGKLAFLQGTPREILDQLSSRGFSRIYVDGGKVIQNFLREDLVDELIVTKVPILIGSGISLFGDLASDLAFTHLKTEVFSNGLVKSQYSKVKN